MEWLQTVVTIIGLIILGWYQRYKIKLLEDQIKFKSEYFDDAKKLIEMLDVDKIKKYRQMEIEILEDEKIRMESKYKNVDIQYKILYEFILKSIPVIPYKKLIHLIDNLPDESNAKGSFKEIKEKIEAIQKDMEKWRPEGLMPYRWVEGLEERSLDDDWSKWVAQVGGRKTTPPEEG